MSEKYSPYLAVIAILLVAASLAGCSGYGAPESPEAQLRFGVDMARRGLWNEALFRFGQAARLSPDNPRVLNNLAVALEAAGRYEDALETYQRALRLAPNDRDLRRNYGRFAEFYASFRPPAPPADTVPDSSPASPPSPAADDVPDAGGPA